MVKETLEVTEWAAKLAALGAKNLAAIIVVLLKDENKTHGATTLKNLLKSEKPLCILQIKEADIKRFKSEAKKYGVLFTAIADKVNGSGFCDIIARQDDITQLNYIMERMGYNDPDYFKLSDDKSEEKSDDEEQPKEEKASEKSDDKQQSKEEQIPDKSDDAHGKTEETHDKSGDDKSKKSEPRGKQRKENRPEKKYTARGEKDDKKPSVKERVEKITQERKGKTDKAPKRSRSRNKAKKPKPKQKQR